MADEVEEVDDGEDTLVAKIAEVRADIEDLRNRDSDKAWSVIATMTNTETRLLKELRELRAARANAEPINPAADLTDEELIEGICEDVAKWPDAAVDRLAQAIEQRRTGRILRVVEGGEG